MALLETKGIVKRFAGLTALNGVNFSCDKGRITGLLGANGSGKSTLSKIITGVYRADAGDIIYKGKKVSFPNPAESKKNGISMIFQNLSLVDDLTVWQNIVLGCEEKRGILLNNTNAKERARKIVNELWPSININAFVYQLSPSDQQIVEIAKALVIEPELLIMDEPTAALERGQVRSLFQYMKKLVERGVAIIFTSHRMKEVMEICDQVTVFKNGNNIGSFDFHQEKRDADAIVRLIADTDRKQVVRHEKRSLSENDFFAVEHLNVPNKLFDISFSLRKGEVLGIGGLSGQGQENLMLALAGSFHNVSTSSVKLKGKEISLKSPSKVIRENIYLVPGDRNAEGLMLEHSVYSNLIFPHLPRKGHPLFIPSGKYRQECAETINQLSIKVADADNPVSTLSGGNAQKVVIGKWMHSDMDILLLSDPVKGVDVGAKQDIYDLVHQLAETHGTGVILYASDADELIENCDRVLIMFEGRIVEELLGDDINEQQIYRATMNTASVEQERTEEIPQ